MRGFFGVLCSLESWFSLPYWTEGDMLTGKIGGNGLTFSSSVGSTFFSSSTNLLRTFSLLVPSSTKSNCKISEIRSFCNFFDTIYLLSDNSLLF